MIYLNLIIEGERNQAMLHNNAAVTTSNNKPAPEQQHQQTVESNQQSEDQQEQISSENKTNHIPDALGPSSLPPTNQSDFGAKSTLCSPLLTSPIDSPRQSIILQPPLLETVQDNPIIVGQVSV